MRGAQVAGSGPVLTVRRAIAMLGLDGVRRGALALRPWPGPLGAEDAARSWPRLVERCKRAGRVALALRPAGYDAEVVYLITLLQNLGRLRRALPLSRRGAADPPPDAAGGRRRARASPKTRA